MRKTTHPNKVQVNLYNSTSRIILNLTDLNLDEVVDRGDHLLVPMAGCAPIKVAESLEDLAAFKTHWDGLPDSVKAKYVKKHEAREVMTAAATEQRVQGAGAGVRTSVQVATKKKKATGNMPSGKDWPNGPGRPW